MIYIFWTCATLEEAREISRYLVEKKLVACANLIPHIESIYEWKSEIEMASETKVILKTMASHYDAVAAYIKANCSYDVPEISSVQIQHQNHQYLEWVEKTLRK